MNLMPIVAFDNFFEDDPPFFGVVPLFCCLEFGVVVFVSGLAVPGFHIMVMNKTDYDTNEDAESALSLRGSGE